MACERMTMALRYSAVRLGACCGRRDATDVQASADDAIFRAWLASDSSGTTSGMFSISFGVAIKPSGVVTTGVSSSAGPTIS